MTKWLMMVAAAIIAATSLQAQTERSDDFSAKYELKEVIVMSRHNIRSKAIDTALQNDGPDVHDTSHKSHGQSHKKELTPFLPVRLPIIFTGQKLPKADDAVQKARTSADRLGNDGSCRRSFYIHADNADKKNVQQHLLMNQFFCL